jgi:YEATS domain-containing protein 4
MSRLRGLTVEKPFVYGSKATRVQRNEEGKTHTWSCYVRSADGSQLGEYVKSVTFTLHPSFAESVRCISKAPFEVSECGWGEFDILIKVSFWDPDERPVVFSHFLKLFPDVQHPGLIHEPVVSELRDEFVFKNPRQAFYQRLTRTPFSVQTSAKEAAELGKMHEAQQRVQKEIELLTRQYATRENEIEQAQQEIAQLREKLSRQQQSV